MTEDEKNINVLTWIRNRESGNAAESLREMVNAVHKRDMAEDLNVDLPEADEEGRARLKAAYKERVFDTLGGLPDLADEALSSEAEEAEKEGYFHYHETEVDTIEEWLEYCLKHSRADGIISDLKFMTATWYPFLKKHDIKPAFKGPRGGLSIKARDAVPFVRKLFDHYESNEEGLLEEVEKVMAKITDETTDRRDIQTLDPTRQDRIPEMTFQTYITAGGKTRVVADVNDLQLRWIENRLRAKADFKMAGDPMPDIPKRKESDNEEPETEELDAPEISMTSIFSESIDIELPF